VKRRGRQRGDASTTDAYDGAVPAEVVMVCGVFGNVPDDDIRTTVEALPMLCAPGGVVIWTRYPRDGSVLATIDAWFRGTGFGRVALETGVDGRRWGVGVHRFAGASQPWRAGVRLFSFVADPDPRGRNEPARASAPDAVLPTQGTMTARRSRRCR
jgi:hypothetical protein